MRSSLAVLLFLTGCGSTTARRTTFPVEMTTSLPGTQTTDSGWTVQLDSARAAVAAVRFFAGKVLLSRRFPWYSLIGGTAWAHPGHYVAGEAMGEWLGPKELDLLTALPSELGTADAITGEYGSLQLTFGPTGVRLVGVATRGNARVSFDTTAFIPSSPIEGIRFEKSLGIQESGRVRIRIDLHTTLSRIDFSAAPAPNADGVSVFRSTDEVFNGFARGILDTGSYLVVWETH